MDLAKYVEQEMWCSFKNNNRTLFERSLWIMGANKYKNAVIKNLITEDITVYYSHNTRQLRGFNGNQRPLNDETLAKLNLEHLMMFIEEYYILKDNLYSLEEKLMICAENNDFWGFKKYYKKFILKHARIFAYEYLISSLGSHLIYEITPEEFEEFTFWKNKGQVNAHQYFTVSFEFIKKFFLFNIDSSILELYSHVLEIIHLLDGKLKVSTLENRIIKRKQGFVLTNLHDAKYNNKVITDQQTIKRIKSRLECLENESFINDTYVTGCSTYEDKLIISGECIVINGYERTEFDVFNKIVVCSIMTPDDVYKYVDARALIVDYGGILSHAAIFSREFHKPCLMGTGLATKVFKTGDIIEINFQKQQAYKI